LAHFAGAEAVHPIRSAASQAARVTCHQGRHLSQRGQQGFGADCQKACGRQGGGRHHVVLTMATLMQWTIIDAHHSLAGWWPDRHFVSSRM